MTPTGHERFSAFLAANPSPRDCIPGKMYSVPCISHPDVSRFSKWSKGWGAYVPLIGAFHEDAAVVGFDPWHIHVDQRFITYPPDLDAMQQASLLGAVVTLSTWAHDPLDESPPTDHYAKLRSEAVLVVRRMMCRRAEPPQFPEAKWREALEKAYSDCKLIDGRCPHRGIDIACGRQLRPGVRQCPGHGLAWNDDGTLHPLGANP
jgi:hypothetical protein